MWRCRLPALKPKNGRPRRALQVSAEGHIAAHTAARRTDHARLIRSPGLTFHLGHSMTAAHRCGVCNFEKRGAFAMSKKNWDRVPIDAQSIDAPLSRAAVFLVVTVASELTALTKVCLALDGLDDLVKTVGFRDLSARLSCIVA